MKKFLLASLVLAFAGGLIALGWHLGQERRTGAEHAARSLLEMRLAQGDGAVYMLHQLDVGQTNALRSALQTQVYASVVVVDGLYPYADRDTQERCRDFLKELAKQRADKAPSLVGNMGLGDAAGTHLESILRKVHQDKKE
jgi:hypothetical protein